MSNIDYFSNMSDDDSDGNFEQSNKIEPLPEGTRVRLSIEDIKWDGYKNSDHLNPNIKWAIESPEEYSKRKIFQTVKLNGDDPNGQYFKADKQEKTVLDAQKMFTAINKNAPGGGLAPLKLKREPTDEEMQNCLIGTQVLAVLGEWNGKNFIRSISPVPEAEKKPVAKKESKPVDNGFDEDSDLIPF